MHVTCVQLACTRCRSDRPRCSMGLLRGSIQRRPGRTNHTETDATEPHPLQILQTATPGRKTHTDMKQTVIYCFKLIQNVLVSRKTTPWAQLSTQTFVDSRQYTALGFQQRFTGFSKCASWEKNVWKSCFRFKHLSDVAMVTVREKWACMFMYACTCGCAFVY